MSVQSHEYDAIVVGAGVAGLTAALTLARAGGRVLVAERHNVVGGCAAFYQRGGYRFDVGATLVGGFGRRGAHHVLNARLGVVVSPERIEPSMVIHLRDRTVVRFGDERWRAERVRAFGPLAEPFWRAQERIADRAWALSARLPRFPAGPASALRALAALRPGDLPLAGTLGRTVDSILPAAAGAALRSFVDAQLLITAQTSAREADLAYGCTALDLAREGTYHFPAGISTIATALARALRAAGGEIRYAAPVAEIALDRRGRAAGVRFADGGEAAATRVVAALPVGDAALLCPALEVAWRARLAALPQRWGAFVLYCGLPADVVPAETATHHQLVTGDGPQGEGNTAFVSFSGAGEALRARGGGRAVTISTHTDVARWERAQRDGRRPELRAEYASLLRAALERVVPGAAARAEILEPADPLTFARYTGRRRGLVGGLPQTAARAVLGAFGHATPVPGLAVCGDTTFPGQSTVGAALGGYDAAMALS